ncbi:enoyl-CoA hydratase [Streptomyces sp. NPDC046909]|uniref:enoyl-CoA hydratase/isomerase family protein n=1 Tax=Streptomyces sp. NPDC046909 TaxID=3155617 RepID=UPI0033F34D38
MTELLVHRSGGVVNVTLNRPERKNAMNTAMLEAMVATFDEIAASQEDRVVVLTGAGDAFCSGSDLSDRQTDPRHPLARMRWIARAAQALYSVPQPVVAMVRGPAVGGGLSLALLADLIIAGSSARFSTVWTKRGLSPDFGGSWLLPRRVGQRAAAELVLLSEVLDAEQAAAIGIVNRVVPDEQVEEDVRRLAAQLAAGPPLALSMAKRLLRAGGEMPFADVLESEAMSQAVNARSEDGAEAIDAFFNKRPPTFAGR